MLTLPRSNPLYENIPAATINLPDTLKKMGAGGFTGYLGYGSTSAEAYFIFIKGALISTLTLEGTRRKTGFDAINSLFQYVLTEGGITNVYRMTPDLAVCTQALLHGETVLKPEQVAHIDLKSVLARMKTQLLTGTVLFTAAEHSGMIFYKDGMPVGFYHDTAQEIETTPVEAQKIAALPGAVIEIRSAPPVDELLHHNFLETLNIDRLWQATQSRLATRQTKVTQPTPPAPPQPSPLVKHEAAPETASSAGHQLDELIEDLHEIAKAYLGRPGALLVDELLEAQSGHNTLLKRDETELFLDAMAKQAVNHDPDARIEEMIDLMRSEISVRLSS